MNAIIFGAGGGIGGALCEALAARGTFNTVFAASRRGVSDTASRIQSLRCDPLNEAHLTEAMAQVTQAGPLTLCISAVGMLSDTASDLTPERTLRAQTETALEAVFRANTIAPALIAKHVIPLMPRNQRAVFAALSARVGSISDNRLGGWHAYRASKAALNMLIRNYAIEQARRSETFLAVGLHPGTVDTALSTPFQRSVPDGKLFTPRQSADYLLDVIDRLAPGDSGKVFDWKGEEVPA